MWMFGDEEAGINIAEDVCVDGNISVKLDADDENMEDCYSLSSNRYRLANRKKKIKKTHSTPVL